MKKWLVTALSVIVIGGATAGVYTSAVNASTSQGAAAVDKKAPTATPQIQGNSESSDNDEELADDVNMTDDGKETADPTEQAVLQQQAAITKDEATKQALTAKQGTVKNAHLEDEDGTVIYNIEIEDGQGQLWEVKVDAKNGKIAIMQQSGDESDQIPDQETND
jgi:uncharacterized membrane protein YkoI